MGNDNRSVVKGVVDVRQSLVRTRRSLIDIRWTLHAESFVRSFVVEDLDEFVEARLLLKEIGGGWFGSFFFQGEMHAFMTAVLLGMLGLDPFDADARSHQTASLLKLNSACAEAKGTPLSLRMFAGRPRSLKSRSNAAKA